MVALSLENLAAALAKVWRGQHLRPIGRSMLCVFLVACWSSSVAMAVDDSEALVNRARASVASRLELMVVDLLDELVYQWKQKPTFAQPTKVALIELTVPSGFNAKLESLAEGHFFDLTIKNPDTNLRMAHCPACTAITTHASPEATVMARGADLDFAKATLGVNADYALYLNFEIHGSQLVLRSRLTSLDTDRLIVEAKSLATDAGHPPLLRRANNLVSAAATRQEYVAMLQGRARFDIPMTLKVSLLNLDNDRLASLAFMWSSVGIESFTNARRSWLASSALAVGTSASQDSAWQVQTGLKRQLWYTSEDLNRPSYFLGAGFTYSEIIGESARIFQADDKLTPEQVIADYKKDRRMPKTSDVGVQLTMELRLAQYLRLGLFAQHFVGQVKNKNFKQNEPHHVGIEFGLSL